MSKGSFLGRKECKNPKGGLTAKCREKYNRETGSNLQAPVTKKTGLTPKEKTRRKLFCARMSKGKGPLKKNGKLTRRALSLRRWNCGSV